MVAFDHLRHQCQTQTEVPRLVAGDERLRQSAVERLRDPSPGIGYGDLDRFAQVDQLQLDRIREARHGGIGVANQLHDRQAELKFVRLEHDFVGPTFDRPARRYGRRQIDTFQELAGRQRALLHRTRLRVPEQLTRQVHTAPDRTLDDVQGIAGGMPCADVPAQTLGAEHRALQLIVEVVREPRADSHRKRRDTMGRLRFGPAVGQLPVQHAQPFALPDRPPPGAKGQH